MRSPTWWTRTLVVLLALLGLLAPVAGCSGDSGDGAAPAESEETPEDPTDVDDPAAFAFGQEVRLTDAGPEPRLLAADVNAPVTIRNVGSTPQEVVFTNPGWDEAGTTTTGPLAPGAVYTLDPIGIASITYRLAERPELTGTIQLETGIDGP